MTQFKNDLYKIYNEQKFTFKISFEFSFLLILAKDNRKLGSELKKQYNKNNNEKQNEIIISFDSNQLNQNNFQLIQQLPDIIKDNGEVGSFELDIFKIDIIQMNEYQDTLIKI